MSCDWDDEHDGGQMPDAVGNGESENGVGGRGCGCAGTECDGRLDKACRSTGDDR